MTAPNILYIHSHDTGRHIAPYGHAVPTPSMTRLADEGVLFTNAFCSGPTCSPSRAALVSGQCAHSSGMIGLAHRGFSMRDYREHLASFLRTAGYESTLVGVQHEADKAERIGYDRIVPVETSGARNVAPAAAGFLRSAPKQPFFLSVGFFETHRVFPEPGPGDDPRRCLPAPTVPNTPETRRDMAAFKTSARQLDAGVGEVLAALEAAGLAGNTLVISTTDHGIAFPGMKCNLTDHGIGVLLVMRGPGGFAGGRVLDGLVSHIDVFPTICELAGIERPAWVQGRSVLPMVRGEAAEVNEEIFAEVSYHAAYEPMRAVRTRRWKYIRRYDGRTRPVLANADDGPSKDVLLAAGWAERPVEAEQLYDLVFDPQERRNVAADPANAATLAEMRGRLERWMRETRDPLLSGKVPAPAGAVVNSPDALSPKDTPQKVG